MAVGLMSAYTAIYRRSGRASLAERATGLCSTVRTAWYLLRAGVRLYVPCGTCYGLVFDCTYRAVLATGLCSTVRTARYLLRAGVRLYVPRGTCYGPVFDCTYRVVLATGLCSTVRTARYLLRACVRLYVPRGTCYGPVFDCTYRTVLATGRCSTARTARYLLRAGVRLYVPRGTRPWCDICAPPVSAMGLPEEARRSNAHLQVSPPFARRRRRRRRPPAARGRHRQVRVSAGGAPRTRNASRRAPATAAVPARTRQPA